MKTILITGTSSGIGLGATVELARRGHRVFASMRDPSRAGELQQALAAAGAAAEVVQLDVTDTASVDRAVREILAAAGRIDVLVNNAGITATGTLESSSDAELLRIFETNTFGPLRTIRAVLPSMRAARSGRIVNVSSVGAHARFGIRLWGLYAASKSALHTLTLELAKEVAPLGIEVVLLEGGVAGLTHAWDTPRSVAANFAGGEYELAERISAAQIAAITSGADGLAASAAMVSDACTVESPPLRFPPERQAGIDACNGMADDIFLRLARGDGDPAVYEGVPGFWALQKQLLTGG